MRHKQLHFGVVTTMQPNATGLRIVAVAGDFEAPLKPAHVSTSSGPLGCWRDVLLAGFFVAVFACACNVAGPRFASQASKSAATAPSLLDGSTASFAESGAGEMWLQ